MSDRNPATPPGSYDGVYQELNEAISGAPEGRQLELAASLVICLCARIDDPQAIRDAIVEAGNPQRSD